MNQKETIIAQARNQIREAGFASAMTITFDIAKFIIHNGIEFEDGMDDLHRIIVEEITCEDIHKVEYANQSTEDHRRKDLFYYLPKDGS